VKKKISVAEEQIACQIYTDSHNPSQQYINFANTIQINSETHDISFITFKKFFFGHVFKWNEAVETLIKREQI
jgi:hypothetical protein